MEDVPLYGNLHYLKTGRKRAEAKGTEVRSSGGWDEGLKEEKQEVTRFLFPVPGWLSQEPRPNPQDTIPGGPTRVSQLWLRKRGGKEVGAFSRVQ